MQNNWQQSNYAQQYFETEREFLSTGLRLAIGPCVLQLGDLLDSKVIEQMDLPYVVKANIQEPQQLNQEPCQSKQAFEPCPSQELVADPAFLPFDVDSFSTVLVPHVLELHKLPHQVLREAHRVLQPEGHIVLTGFNPNSFIGLQRFIYKRAVPPGRYYSVRRVIDWLQLLGFEVTASAMFQYAPLSQQAGVTKTFAFLESVGGRWLPMTGGAYMIAAKKRVVNCNLLEKSPRKVKRSKLIAATAKHINPNSSK